MLEYEREEEALTIAISRLQRQLTIQVEGVIPPKCEGLDTDTALFQRASGLASHTHSVCRMQKLEERRGRPRRVALWLLMMTMSRGGGNKMSMSWRTSH